MRQNGSFGILVFVIIAGLGGILAFLVNGMAGNVAAIGIGVVAFAVAMKRQGSCRSTGATVRCLSGGGLQQFNLRIEKETI